MIMLKQMIILFMLMAVGIILRKLKIMNDAVSKGMSSIVVNVASPAFILSAGINRDDYVEPKMLLTCVIAAIIIYTALIIVAVVLPFLLGVEKDHIGTYRIMTIFSNIGFMGFPIVLASYGETALLYAAVFQFPYNLLIYTYGIQVIQGKNDNSDEGIHINWKEILNIGVISVFLSIALYIFKVEVPESVETFIDYLSGMTVPMSMMVIGYSLGGMKIRELISDKKLMFFSIIKLIIIPIIFIFLLRIFIKDPILLGVCFVMVATPVGSMTAMLAEAYDGDKETATRGVALTTLLSVITIPLCGMVI